MSNFITVPMHLAVRLCDWHSSMWDPIYAVGSSGIAKQKVPEDIFRSALSNMESNLDNPAHSENRQEIVEITSQMQSILGEAELRTAVVSGMARYFWASCWTDMVERGEAEGELSGCDALHIAPPTPAATVASTSEILDDVLSLNETTLEKLVADHGDAYDLGLEIACACLGNEHDLPDGFETPYIESSIFWEEV